MSGVASSSAVPAVSNTASGSGKARQLASKLGGSIKDGASAGAKHAVSCGSNTCVGFRDFLIKGKVIDIAIAFVVGAAFTDLIKTFVSSFVTPLLAAIGSKSFEQLFFTVRGQKIAYGNFINALITFITVCLVVYFLIVLPLLKLLEFLDPKNAVRPCPECLQDIPSGARKCKCCGSSVPLGLQIKEAIKNDESGELAKDLKDVRDSNV